MGAEQIAKIERSIAAVYKDISGPDDPPKYCATLETQNAAGAEVWIQVLAGSVNMMYPFDDEPVARLQAAGALTPKAIELLDWEPNGYATFNVDERVSPRDEATFVDQLLTKVLGCDDASYDIRESIEELET